MKLKMVAEKSYLDNAIDKLNLGEENGKFKKTIIQY